MSATSVDTRPNRHSDGLRKKSGRAKGGRGRGTGRPHTTKKFKGLCPELEEYVFDTGTNQASSFVKTKKAVVGYAWRTFSPEVGKALQYMKCMRDLYPRPRDPDHEAELSFTEKELARYRARSYLLKIEKYESDMRKAYGVIYGQCTDELKQDIEAENEFGKAAIMSDPILLLTLIQKVCFNHRSEMYPPVAAIRALKALYNSRQPEYMSNTEWLEHFKNMVRAADACGAPIEMPGIRQYVKQMKHPNAKYETLEPSEKKTVDAAVRSITLSTLYVENADRRRYASLCRSLENDFLKKQKNYPESLKEAQKLLNSYKPEPHKQQTAQPRVDKDNNNSGVAFAQEGSGGKQPDKSKMRCWKCGKLGHLQYENKCKEADIIAYEAEKRSREDTESPIREGQTHVTDCDSDSEPEQEVPATGEAGNACLHYAVVEEDDYLAADSFEQQSQYHMMFCTIGRSFPAKSEPSIDYNSLALSQARGQINPDWMLLDNQSTVNVMCNPRLLTNIRRVRNGMTIYCNAGETKTNWMGDLAGIGPVWYHEGGIANILSLSKVKRTNRVAYDSHNGNVFRLYSRNGKSFRDFKESEQGLYYSHMRTSSIVLNSVGTVAANKDKFSALDKRRADKARRFQDILNLPTKELIRLVDNKYIPNCPVTRRDLQIADEIYGPSVIGLQGKTVRRPEEHVRVEIAELPESITQHYMEVTLGVDIMYVNGIRFFITISRHIQFATGEVIGDAETSTLLKSMDQVIKTYRKRGFSVDVVNMDNQFVPLRNELEGKGISPNFVARNEHVPEVERFIRTLKERARGVQSSVPFTKFPAMLTKGMVDSQLFWWNSVPKQTGVSMTLSPRAIVIGLSVDYIKHCRLMFGEYVHTHEESDNDTGHARTIGAIALRPTGNEQGGHYFFSLKSGRIINRNQWTRLPMPDDVVTRVHRLARRRDPGFVFQDRNRELIPDEDPDDDDDSTYVPPIDDDSTAASNSSESTGVDSTGVDTVEYDVDSVDATGVNAHQNNNETNTRELRPRRARTYDHLKTVGYINNVNRIDKAAMETQTLTRTAFDSYNKETKPEYKHVNEIILTQYSMKQGLKIFGARGTAAVKKELQQVHDRKVVKPVQPTDLTREQRSRALAYLMFLKEKRCGTIKGRGCGDGRKQRDWMSKEDTTSPTVSTTALILSCIIDAHENRDVATTDIPGAFLQTNDDSGSTHLRFEGTMVDLLVEIDPNTYSAYVQYDKKGRKFMYAECLKAIYGTLNAALLFWLKLSGDLTKWGFKANPYDWCVMNKTINGKQCTILWHVDDLKISHVDPNVVTDVLNRIDAEYGKEAPITTTRGKIHDYLGMTLDFSVKGQVSMTMIDYIDKMLNELPEDMMKGESVTPAADHLFKSNDDTDGLLSGDDKEIFHRNTAKLLFLSKRARPDIQLPVAYLCTRVQNPNKDDWKKLHRVMGYLRNTIGIPLLLSMDDKGTMRWYVDAAFAVHNDMKSHTGMAMTMGRGAAVSASQKQKLVTRSSTEAELVGVDDEMSQVLWCRHFLEAQGVTLKDNILYQDNQASMRLEKNGKKSSGKRTRHINIRYFFITDRIEKGDVSVEYCPTLEMIGDYFTKPLQGSHFRRLRNMIMGIDEVDIPRYNAMARASIQLKQQQRRLQDDLVKIKQD